jgi:alpha-tubulin suppressor-like RCC1 family protein
LKNVTGVAAGREFSLALKADGTVVSWGKTNAVPGLPGSPAPVPPLTNAVAIAAGREHYLALKADGTVAGGGSDVYGQATGPAGLSNVVAIAAGEYHSLALRSDGQVFAWGIGKVQRTNDIRFPPSDNRWNFGQAIVPAGLSNVMAIGAGHYHSLAIVEGGAPFLTSALVDRRVAQGTTSYLYAPAVGARPLAYQWKLNGVELPGATNALLVLTNSQLDHAGTYSVTVTNAFGKVTSAGANVGVVPGFIASQPQDQNTFRGGEIRLRVSVTSAGPLSYQWQYNGIDIPGASTSTLILTNVQVAQSGLYSVRVWNEYGSLQSEPARVSVGQILAWGDNAFGQTNLPPGLTNIAAIAAGDYHTLALKQDGTVIAWGQNSIGQATAPAGLSNVVAIAAGWAHSLALKADGTVVAWGNEQDPTRATPRGLSNVVAIADGGGHSLALKADGTVTAWGLGVDGQTRVPAGLSNAVAIAAGSSQSLALKKDGTLAAWGAAGSPEGRVPAGISNVVAIAAGFQHNAALRADGTVFVWGLAYAGQTNMPAGLSNVVAISAGGHHTLALKGDGTLVSWGDTAVLRQVPAAVSNIVTIECGAAHDVAIVDEQYPLVANIVPAAASRDGIVFRETGIMEQVVRVYNRSSLMFPALRIYVQNIPQTVRVYNAGGFEMGRGQYIALNRPLAPGASIDLTIEYISSDGSVPVPVLAPKVVLPSLAREPVVLEPITGVRRLDNSKFLLEFESLFGRDYFIQYSSDLSAWRTAQPPLAGTGAEMPWIDNGPPKTETHPSFEAKRFYRVLTRP